MNEATKGRINRIAITNALYYRDCALQCIDSRANQAREKEREREFIIVVAIMSVNLTLLVSKRRF